MQCQLINNGFVQKALFLRRRSPRLNLLNQLLHFRPDRSVVESLLQIVHASAFSTPVTRPARVVVADAIAGTLLGVAFLSHSVQLVRFSHFNADDGCFCAQGGVSRCLDVFVDEPVQEIEFNLKDELVI